ncbi:MAG: bL21 family ribosomal protein, partial [Isosphaeraceae bacterium]
MDCWRDSFFFRRGPVQSLLYPSGQEANQTHPVNSYGLRGLRDLGRWDYPDRESFGPREERWRMYAIIEDGSHQFKVSEGDHVRVDRRDGKAGDEVVFPKVLLIAGTPA